MEIYYLRIRYILSGKYSLNYLEGEGEGENIYELMEGSRGGPASTI